MPLFKLFRLPDLVVELRNILIKGMGIGKTKNHLQLPKTMFLPQKMLKITISNYQIRYTVKYSCYSHVIRMSVVFTRLSLVYHSYVLVCYPYFTHMSLVCYLYVLVCYPCHSYVTGMLSICHSYVLVCHPYVTRIYSYVILMSLVCRPYVVSPWTFN